MSDLKTYDLVVLGGGPAGITAAMAASVFGHNVALIDNELAIGGAGINTGTVPSKTLRETALALSGLKSRQLYGVDLSIRREVTVTDFLGHEEKVRDAFHTSISHRLQDLNATTHRGSASFVDAHTVKVTPDPKAAEQAPEAPREPFLIAGEKILIATGSAPVRPQVFPFGQCPIYDSDSVLSLAQIPKTLAVIGAGVIGSEYACTFRALGADVHIVDGRKQLLPFLDGEVSQALESAIARSGIQFHWDEKVQKCVPIDSEGIRLEFTSGHTLTADAVLVAAGRQSNTAKLNLDLAGVAIGERGIIPVNEFYQTNIDHIYAAGDVIGFPALASTSMEQSRRAIRHALNLGASPLAPLLPNGIYTIPEASMVGETEEALKKSGTPYIKGRADYRENARGRIIGDQDGFLKLLFRREDLRLVGVHVMGELATEVVHIGLMAMMTSSTASLFLEACFNMPTLGNLYKTATIEALRSAQITTVNPRIGGNSLVI